MKHRSGWAIALMTSVLAAGLLPACSVIDAYSALVPADAGSLAGVVVVGGFVIGDGSNPDQYFLTALDPKSGNEFAGAHRTMTVAGIQYDRVNDLWYIFESATMGQIFPLWNETFYVHAMRFNADGTWTELAEAAIPPAVSTLTTTLLTSSIAYVAYADPNDRTALGLVVLDTSAIFETGKITASAPFPIVDQSSGQPVALKNLIGLTGAPSLGATPGGNVLLWFRASTGGAAPAPSPAEAGTIQFAIDDDGPDADGTSGEGGPFSGGDDASPSEDATIAFDATIADGASPTDDATVVVDAAVDAGIASIRDATAESGSRSGADASREAGGAEAGSPAGGPPPTPALVQQYAIHVTEAIVAPKQFAGAPAGPQMGLASIALPGAQSPSALVVTHPVGAAQASLWIYDMFADYLSQPPAVPLGPFSFTFGTDFAHQDLNVQPPAFSTCDNTVFVIGTNVARNVFAVPLGAAQAGFYAGAAAPVPANGNTEHSGQGVYFEPYTNTVLAPYAQADTKYLTAFRFDPSDGGELSARTTDWSPPADFRINFVAIRDNFVCAGP